jgi:hypothetical protein
MPANIRHQGNVHLILQAEVLHFLQQALINLLRASLQAIGITGD